MSYSDYSSAGSGEQARRLFEFWKTRVLRPKRKHKGRRLATIVFFKYVSANRMIWEVCISQSNLGCYFSMSTSNNASACSSGSQKAKSPLMFGDSYVRVVDRTAPSHHRVASWCTVGPLLMQDGSLITQFPIAMTEILFWEEAPTHEDCHI